MSSPEVELALIPRRPQTVDVEIHSAQGIEEAAENLRLLYRRGSRPRVWTDQPEDAHMKVYFTFPFGRGLAVDYFGELHATSTGTRLKGRAKIDFATWWVFHAVGVVIVLACATLFGLGVAAGKFGGDPPLVNTVILLLWALPCFLVRPLARWQRKTLLSNLLTVLNGRVP